MRPEIYAANERDFTQFTSIEGGEEGVFTNKDSIAMAHSCLSFPALIFLIYMPYGIVYSL